MTVFFARPVKYQRGFYSSAADQHIYLNSGFYQVDMDQKYQIWQPH